MPSEAWNLQIFLCFSILIVTGLSQVSSAEAIGEEGGAGEAMEASSSPPPPPLSLPSLAAEAPSAINRSDARTLLSLRASLGIRSRYWPRKTDACLIWKGVSCSSDGYVVSITLTGLRRTVKGAANPSFSAEPLRNFSHLLAFNSSGFPLPGSIPDWLGSSLPSLQILDLSSSSIVSSIPASLGNLTQLLKLSIARNNLTGPIPPSLGKLASLAFLDLSYNNLTGSIPDALASGSSLEALDLGFNALSGAIPASLGALPSLTSLRLSRNMLSSAIPQELANCAALEVLSLDRNAISGSVPDRLGELPNLLVLSLFSNNLTGYLPSGFARAQQILLSDNFFYGTIPFSPEDLLVNNVSLDLSSNYFEGSLPNPFPAAAKLDNNCLTNVVNQRSLDQCQSFYAEQGLAFQGATAAPSPSLSDHNSSKRRDDIVPIVVGASVGGFVLVLLVLLLVFFLIIRRRRGRRRKGEKHEQREPNSAVAAKKGVSAPPFPPNVLVNLVCLGEKFTYAQLQQATGGFELSNLLKSGHSGDLYRGVLDGGVSIVVKRIDFLKVRKEGFVAELEIFSKASHTRLVPLIGHCFEMEEEKLLVYKFMPGKDLGFALHKKNVDDDVMEDSLPSLDWITRLKIAIGAAEGLNYLHHECSPPLVHRDVQASSILLDDKFEVRLGSLSDACAAVGESHLGVLSRILRRSQTSEHGEAAGSVPTCAYDVYCFGKVLLELVSGKLGISGSTDPSTDTWIEWALSLISVDDKESISKILDPSLLVDEDLLEEVWAMSIVAKSCLNPKPAKRPPMRYILKALENPLKVVREDKLNGSGRSRGSSHGSWNAALFGSWRHNSSDAVAIPGSLREEHLQKSMLKQQANGGSQGSQGEVSQRRPGSSEIFPEPVEDSVVQAPTNTNSEKQDS